MNKWKCATTDRGPDLFYESNGLMTTCVVSSGCFKTSVAQGTNCKDVTEHQCTILTVQGAFCFQCMHGCFCKQCKEMKWYEEEEECVRVSVCVCVKHWLRMFSTAEIPSILKNQFHSLGGNPCNWHVTYMMGCQSSQPCETSECKCAYMHYTDITYTQTQQSMACWQHPLITIYSMFVILVSHRE